MFIFLFLMNDFCAKKYLSISNKKASTRVDAFYIYVK